MGKTKWMGCRTRSRQHCKRIRTQRERETLYLMSRVPNAGVLGVTAPSIANAAPITAIKEVLVIDTCIAISRPKKEPKRIHWMQIRHNQGMIRPSDSAAI